MMAPGKGELSSSVRLASVRHSTLLDIQDIIGQAEGPHSQNFGHMRPRSFGQSVEPRPETPEDHGVHEDHIWRAVERELIWRVTDCRALINKDIQPDSHLVK